VDNPYLNRSESIILTTHRVSVDSVLHNAMLTSERLILTDDGNANSQQRTILLQDIISLRSGKIPSGEPAIVLSLTTAEKGMQSLYLVFSQQYGERRKQERDEWVKKIMELRVALVQKRTSVEISPDNPKQGLQPMVRHWIAPEKIRPLSNVGNLQPDPVPFTILPDDEPDLFAPSSSKPKDEVLYASPVESSYPERSEHDAIGGDEPALGDVPSTEPAVPETLPGKPEEPVLPDDESIASESYEKPTTLGEPIQEAIEWPVIHGAEPALADTWSTEKRSSENILGTADEPALSNFPLSEITPSVQSITIALESLLPPQESDKPLENLSQMPTIGENPVEDIENPPNLSPLEQQFLVSSIERLEKTEGYSPSEIAPQHPDYRDQSPQPDHSIPEPALADSEEKTVLGQFSPQRFSQSYPPGESSGKNTIFILGCVVLSVLIIIGGVMFLSSFSHKDITPPSMPIVNITPSITVELPSPVLIPQSGLWVRVNSTSPYLGQAGNPDLLKPVSGTGNQIYKILNSNGIVQVDVKKQDNSGSSLSVEIYNDGYLLASRTVTAPMGSIDLLIDSRTGYPPGFTANGSILR